MPDIRLHPLTPADADDARALWNRSAPHDPLSPSLFAEKVWGAPAGTALAAHQSGEVVGLGVGVLWPVPAETRGSLRLLAVAPEARRRGVATALVERLAEHLAGLGASALRLAEAAPNYLTPGVDARYGSGRAFAAARGFREVGESVNLGVDLASRDWATAEAQARLAEAGVTVRRAGDGDRQRLGRLLAAQWPAWQAEADRALARSPPTLHLAIRDGEAVAFAAHSTNNAERGWFGPMGTAPEARGLGLGEVLLLRCLADLRARGLDRATIAWAAALPFYARTAGAAVERRFLRFERPL